MLLLWIIEHAIWRGLWRCPYPITCLEHGSITAASWQMATQLLFKYFSWRLTTSPDSLFHCLFLSGFFPLAVQNLWPCDLTPLLLVFWNNFGQYCPEFCIITLYILGILVSFNSHRHTQHFQLFLASFSFQVHYFWAFLSLLVPFLKWAKNWMPYISGSLIHVAAACDSFFSFCPCIMRFHIWIVMLQAFKIPQQQCMYCCSVWFPPSHGFTFDFSTLISYNRDTGLCICCCNSFWLIRSIVPAWQNPFESWCCSVWCLPTPNFVIFKFDNHF